MTQEEKQLLLVDLCARLPYYGLMVRWGDDDFNIIGVGFGRIALLKPFMSSISGSPLVEEVRPYLRPMSSMTEEEKKEYGKICELDTKILENCPMNGEPFPALYNSQDWLLANHFDFRELIPMGLALEAHEGMYKTE